MANPFTFAVHASGSSRLLARLTKTPRDRIVVDVDFTDWLAAYADTIELADVEVDAGLLVENSTVLSGNRVVRVTLSDGVSGYAYRLLVDIVTVTLDLIKRVELLVKVKGDAIDSIEDETLGDATLVGLDDGEI